MDKPSNPITPQRVRVPPPQFCECGDPGCPVCEGHCRKPARTTVYRSDMEDETGTPMCEGCAADCMDSGLFYTKESVSYRVVDALINEEGASAAKVIEAERIRLNRPFWGHSAGTRGSYRPGHSPSPVNRYTGKIRLKGSPPASVSDKDKDDLYSIEPMKEPPGSAADLTQSTATQGFLLPQHGGNRASTELNLAHVARKPS